MPAHRLRSYSRFIGFLEASGFLRYMRILKYPGVLGFFMMSVPARIGSAMLSMALVVLVGATRHSYAAAGSVAGVMAISGALGGPMTARLSDRYGQRRALPGCIGVHTLALGGLVATTISGWYFELCYPLAVLVGVSIPQTGSLTRRRWAYLLRPSAGLQTAFALESLTDDLSYVVGPALATTLATQIRPVAGAVVAICLILAGGLGLAIQRRSEPPRSGDDHERRHTVAGALSARGMGALIAAFIGVGAVFGTLQVSVTAFTSGNKAPELAGPIYSVFALASMLAGIGYGTIAWRSSLRVRLTRSLLILTIACAILPFVPTNLLLTFAIALPGFAIAPTLISGNALAERTVPEAVLTEAFAWLSAASGLGIATGAAVSGQLTDALNAHWAFATASLGAAIGTATYLVGRRNLR